MNEAILYEQGDGIVTLTLNRPDLRNPITDTDMVDSLVGALNRMHADTSVRVGILTGRGTAFSSGGNLRQMGSAASSRPPVETRHHYDTGVQRIPRAFESLDVPMIAAVNGPAIGAGCDLACMCDIRIAGRSARFAESFVKVGLVPGDGGAWLLQHAVGYSKACELAFTGDQLSAEEALSCGLVSRVVADDQLMRVARELAGRIAANPPHVVRLTKRLMLHSRQHGLESVLQLASAMQSLAHSTTDHVEAVQAMLEKRLPRFTGS
jgi:enoyl-CoA hydratase/carnithine racemase